MKICFVTTGDIKHIATAKRALGMANPLVELGWDVHILMEDTIENRKRVSLECCPDVKAHFFTQKGVLEEVRYKKRKIKQINPDYVYLCAFVARNFVSKPKYSKILIEHCELDSKIPDLRIRKKILMRLLEIYSPFKADGIICASKYLYRVYQKKCNRLKRSVPILYCPYAYSTLINHRVKLENIPSKFKKLTDKYNFVFLGTIIRSYGAFTMIEAIRILRVKTPNVRLILLGRGIHFDDVSKFVSENDLQDNVLMPGYIEEQDIQNYFSIADAFLSPMNNTIQDWARCPSKLYMYLPYQKPIITCKVGEPAIVLGEQGIYYTVGSSESLSDSMYSIIKDKKTHIVNFETHTWEHRVKEFNEWIKQVFN